VRISSVCGGSSRSNSWFRLNSGRNSKADRHLSALYDRVNTIAEDYDTLLKSSVDMAKSGIALSEQMVDFVDYVESTGGKGKGMKDQLLKIVNLAQVLARRTSGLPSDYERIKEHLSYLSSDIQTKHDKLVGLKDDRHSFNQLLKWLSIGIGCLIVMASVVAIFVAAPPTAAITLGTGAIVAAGAGALAAKLALVATLGGALVGLLSQFRKGEVLSLSCNAKIAELFLIDDTSKTAVQLQGAIEFLNRMQNEISLACSHMVEMENFWLYHIDALHELATSSRRVKMDRSSVQTSKLTAAKGDWQRLGAAFTGYVENVRSNFQLRPFREDHLTWLLQTSKIPPIRKSIKTVVSAERVLL
jgi:hypothetical protein